jgi:hypothetical protein
MKRILSLCFVVATALSMPAENHRANWRAATAGELQALLPARATVEKEHIETEMRTASGITDGHGKLIAGVVLITAGYSAEGKYSHYLVVQHPLNIGELSLAPGNYVFGWQREPDALDVKFYEAVSGKYLGTVAAHRIPTSTRVESFRIWPPSEKQFIQIGRFGLPYQLKD